MKTVVTGGTGFIGSHLVKGLLAQNREVIVASDFAQLGTENLSSLGIEPFDVEIRKADLSDSRQAVKAVERADRVFHLAARVGSLEYLHGTELSELTALQTNLVIDANTFKACREMNVKKLIYASSCAVYSRESQSSPGAVFSEDDLSFSQDPPRTPGTGHRTIINPDGGYGWAKLLAEVELQWLKYTDIGIARIFNIYGENEPLWEKAHVVADLIRKAILHSQQEFIVWGDGKQSRDFLNISDCVDALLQLETRASNPPVTVNIGSGEPVSIGTIAEKVVGFSRKNIKIAYDSTKPAGPISRTANITRARTLMNWQPKVSLDDGLRRTYAWVEKRLKG